MRPEGRTFFFPKGKRFPAPPFSFVPHCAQRSGGPFLFHRLRSPHTGAPCVGRRTRGAAQMGRGGFAAEKRTGRWSGPRENAPGGTRISAPPEDEDGPLDPHLAGRVRFTKDCVGCRGALLLQVGLRASWPRRFFSGTARRHRLGPSGPRRKCGVRRREPAPRATRVYEIKRGPRSAVRCGEQKRWWGRKHPSWRG